MAIERVLGTEPSSEKAKELKALLNEYHQFQL
jgi:hypothetical protein